MGFFAKEAAKRETGMKEKMQALARLFLCVWVA